MVSGIVLAAGSSRRMGQPKQLLPWAGKPLLEHVIDAAAGAELDEIVVVLGHAADEIRSALKIPPHARFVENPEHVSGQASSLRIGLLAASLESRAALVLLGDQPGVTPEAILSVVHAWERAGTPVARASYGGTPGHPVALGRELWEGLEGLHGDEGARTAFLEHPDWITSVELPGSPPLEVDTPEDYQRLIGEVS